MFRKIGRIFKLIFPANEESYEQILLSRVERLCDDHLFLFRPISEIGHVQLYSINFRTRSSLFIKS